MVGFWRDQRQAQKWNDAQQFVASDGPDRPPLNSNVRHTKEKYMDDAAYEKLETLCGDFQRQWIAILRDTLKKHKVPSEIAKSICGEFSFDLAML